MKFSSNMRFPHPVLSPDTGDFANSEFEVDLTIIETVETGGLSLEYESKIGEAGIEKLVASGKASTGAFVRCSDTYFNELRMMSWPKGIMDFVPGSLINNVTIRPVIWLLEDVDGFSSPNLHPEFEPPFNLGEADIIAIGAEQTINVGKEKLPPLESIFTLSRSPDVPHGTISINLEEDRISVLASDETYEMISQFRHSVGGRAINMAAVYLPAVMEVLDNLRGNTTAFEHLRWFQPFRAKCEFYGIDLEEPELLRDAQKLLVSPLGGLKVNLQEAEG